MIDGNPRSVLYRVESSLDTKTTWTVIISKKKKSKWLLFLVVFLVVNKEIKQELNHKLRSEGRKSKPGFYGFFFSPPILPQKVIFPDYTG